MTFTLSYTLDAFLNLLGLELETIHIIILSYDSYYIMYTDHITKHSQNNEKWIVLLYSQGKRNRCIVAWLIQTASH